MQSAAAKGRPAGNPIGGHGRLAIPATGLPPQHDLDGSPDIASGFGRNLKVWPKWGVFAPWDWQSG